MTEAPLNAAGKAIRDAIPSDITNWQIIEGTQNAPYIATLHTDRVLTDDEKRRIRDVAYKHMMAPFHLEISDIPT